MRAFPAKNTLPPFWRNQFWQEIAITPDVQYIRNSALIPETDHLWGLGLRARLAF